MKTLTLVLVLALSGFGQVGAEELSLYCVELRSCEVPVPCGGCGITNHVYSWFDSDQLHVGDIVRVDYWTYSPTGATCQSGQEQRNQHRTVLLSSCTGSSVSNEGWMFFNSNHNGEKFAVVSVSPY
jgi:hypothetical protein